MNRQQQIKTRGIRFALGLALALALAALPSTRAADTLTWNTKSNLVSADIRSTGLLSVLEQIAATTRWNIYVEPETLHQVSTKFRDLPPGQALSKLLGDVNYALVPETNAPARLYVFRTTRGRATQRVMAKASVPKVIPNELIVRLKPGANIDDIAKQLGAKVLGKIDGLNAYRLQFDSAEATEAARSKLATNSEVASVESNYSIDRPSPPGQVALNGAPPPAAPQLTLKPPPSNGKVVVGLIDTAVQPLGNGLDQFLLKQISVAGDPQLDPNSPSHGTSMAETILRNLPSTTSVQILPVDVYGANVSTSTFDVASGVAQAVNGGATVLNLSLGSEGDSQVLRDIIKDAISKNIAVIAAAGNQPVTTPFYPAAYSDLGVIAVTAIDQGQLADYANRGTFINAGAPGTGLVIYNGQAYYVTGTSTSAAVVSGLAAGYMDANHANTTKAEQFVLSNFGVKITPK